jgi:hypothetical protein
MFGMKKRAAVREAERRVIAGKIARLHEQRLSHDAARRKKAARSPAEQTKAIGNSRAQRAQSAPSV